MLPNAVSQSRAEWEVGKRIKLWGIDVVPPVWVEYFGVFVKCFIEVGWNDAHRDNNIFFDGYFA